MLYGFVKAVRLIFKFTHGIVKGITWICWSCYIDLLNVFLTLCPQNQDEFWPIILGTYYFNFDFYVKYNIPFDFVLDSINSPVTFNLNIPQRWSRTPVEEPGASSNHQFGYKWDVNWPGPVTTSDWSRTGVNKKYKYWGIQIQIQIQI